MTYSEEDRWIGDRLIEAGVIDGTQRDKVLEIQSEAVNSHVRFGDLAIRQGYCESNQIESIGGFLGGMLVEAELLTQEQLDVLLKMQVNMRKGGLLVPNLGDLAAIQEYCEKKDIEDFIAVNKQQHIKRETDLPEETSDW